MVFGQMDAERAFARVLRARRRAWVSCVLRFRRCCRACGLALYDSVAPQAAGAVAGGVRELPLAAIRGTLEPSRAAEFDGDFRPTSRARRRWQRVWLAEQRGAVLPPIAVVRVGDGYAVRDGHHRVSVAAARGAVTIDAVVTA